MEPKELQLGGFGGGLVKSVGLITLQADLQVESVVVDADLARADMVLGQPELSGQEIILMVQQGKVSLRKDVSPLDNITLSADELQTEASPPDDESTERHHHRSWRGSKFSGVSGKQQGW